MTELKQSPAKRQKYLGNKGLVVFLALLSAFVPLSNDLYLPALPTMTKFYNVAESVTNLTLILFMAFFSLATLVWGPLSDKYGRRPILIAGLSGYTVASILCATSADIYQLIIFRILQAIGAGSANAISTAIVKDVYEGKKRESILAIVMSMVVVSPALAPVIGALLLEFISWRGIFFALALLGVLVVAGALAFQETLASKTSGSIFHALGRLRVVLKNPGFTTLLFIFSVLGIAFLSFITLSSYIYQDTFGLSSQEFSYFFAFNASGLLLGPLVYMRVSKHFKRFTIITACFTIMILGGTLVCTVGRLSPWAFALTLLPAMIAGSCTRPPGTYLMLEQQKGDTGSASSLISSCATIFGSIGMALASFGTGSLILVVGGFYVALGLLCGGTWLIVTKKPYLNSLRGM